MSLLRIEFQLVTMITNIIALLSVAAVQYANLQPCGLQQISRADSSHYFGYNPSTHDLQIFSNGRLGCYAQYLCILLAAPLVNINRAF